MNWNEIDNVTLQQINNLLTNKFEFNTSLIIKGGNMYGYLVEDVGIYDFEYMANKGIVNFIDKVILEPMGYEIDDECYYFSEGLKASEGNLGLATGGIIDYTYILGETGSDAIIPKCTLPKCDDWFKDFMDGINKKEFTKITEDFDKAVKSSSKYKSLSAIEEDFKISIDEETRKIIDKEVASINFAEALAWVDEFLKFQVK